MPETMGQGFKRYYHAVYRALRSWNQLHIARLEAFEGLQLFREVGFHRPDVEPAHKRRLLNDLLLDCIQQLEGSQELEAAVLRHRFIKGEIIVRAANQLNLSQDQLNRIQRQAVTDLTQLLLGREQAQCARQAATMLADLPRVGQGPLIDAQYNFARLLEWASARQAPFIAALVGLGGVGKTSLAATLVREVVPTFRYDRVLWIDARSKGPWERHKQPLLALLAHSALPEAASSPESLLVQLRRGFVDRNWLVVLDHLDDGMGEQTSLDELARLSNPAKFLLVGRRRFAPSENGQILAVPEWSPEASELLVHQYAHDGGLADGLSSLDGISSALHDLVGGNPAALRLAMDLLAALPMGQVQRAFQTKGDAQVDSLYHHIYRGLWRDLSTPSRQLLHLLAKHEGTEYSYRQIRDCGLPEVETRKAIKGLHQHCLLERGGTPTRPRYRMARLTRSFLRSRYVNLIDGERKKPRPRGRG